MIRFDQQHAGAIVRWRHADLHGVAGVVARLVQLQLDLVRACLLAEVLVVPAVAGEEREHRGELRCRVVHLDPVAAPRHRKLDLGRAARGDVDVLFLDQLQALVGIGLPAAVALVQPVEIAQLALQPDLQVRGGHFPAVGVRTHDLEAGIALALGSLLRIEQRPHTDQLRRRPVHPFEQPGDRAAAAFVDAAGDGDRQRRDRLHVVGQAHVLGQLTLRIELAVEHIVGAPGQLDGGIAEVGVLHRLQRVHLGRHQQLGGEAVAVGGRAIQVARIHLQLQRLARLQQDLRAGQRHLHALGQELLDVERKRLHRLLAGRVKAEFQLPQAGRRVGGNHLAQLEIVEVARFQPLVQQAAPVRLLQPHEQRLRLHRLAILVAQQRRSAQRLAGPVQVAAGPGEHLERRLTPAADVEVRHVQRGPIERQHRHVLAVPGDQHVGWTHLVRDQRIAVAVGGGLEPRVAAVVVDLHVDAGHRRAVAQRSHVQQHVVAVDAQVQAEVADEEDRGVVRALERAALLDHRHVHAGLGQLGNALHRQVGHGALVGIAAQGVVVGVDRVGHVGDRPAQAGVLVAGIPVAHVVVQLVAVAVLVGWVGAEQVGQRVLVHVEELHVGVVHVHRHQRQAARAACGQHAAMRGKTHRGRQVAGIDVALDRVPQGAAVGGEQAILQLHRVARVGLHVGKLQRLVVVLQVPAAADHFAAGTGHRDQRIECLG